MKTIMAISVSFLAITITGCNKERAANERPTPVEVKRVEAFAGNDEKRFSAVIQPYEQVELSFRVGGYVQSIAQTRGIEGRSRSIQDGDRVPTGAILARLHASDYRARVEQARAALAESQSLLAKAEQDRTRAERLFDSQSLTKPDFDAAKANFESTQARVESAQARLTEANTSAVDTVLRAPFAATVLKRNITQGTLASPGMPAFVLADTSIVKAIFGVPDKLIPRMQIGSTLSLRADAFLNSELKGRVSRVSASADAKSRVFEVEVSIPNPKDELKVGMITTLVVDDVVPEAGAPVVPIAALVSSTKRPGNYAIYTAAQENGRTVARLVEVELGRTLGNVIVLTSGPKIGDPIVTNGAGLLRDGEPIEMITNDQTELAKKQ
jgi:RND family efflux transporter MFP subunit